MYESEFINKKKFSIYYIFSVKDFLSFFKKTKHQKRTMCEDTFCAYIYIL